LPDSPRGRTGANIGQAFDRVSIAVTALTAALLLAALAPLFAVEIPAMLDYPNHLARMYLLAGPPNPAYQPHWGLYPDLAMDLIVPALARAMTVATATKVFLAASQVLVVTGAVFLELTVKGRHRLGGLGAMLVLFSLPFAWGQMNFMFGVGLAAWGVGLWIRLRRERGWIRWIVHAGAVAALLICHFFDLGIYGLVIGLYELSCLDRASKLAALIRLAAFMASPVVIGLAMMALFAGPAAAAADTDWDFGLKLGWAAIFMNVYNLPLSMLTAAALLGLLLALTVTRRLSLTRGGVWIGAGLAIAYLVLPRQMLGSQYLDVRLLTVAAILLPAFMTTAFSGAPWRFLPLAAVVAIIALNDTSAALAWVDFQRDYKEFKASFALLAPGSAVLIGQADQTRLNDQPLFYAATLAAPMAGVFVSSLYAEPGMQPIEPRPRYRGLAVKAQHDAVPPRLSVLRAAMADAVPAATPPNIVHWPQRYRYLYLVGAHGRDLAPTGLKPLFAGRRFGLYEINAAISATR
jgi:hypothetical protein